MNDYEFELALVLGESVLVEGTGGLRERLLQALDYVAMKAQHLDQSPAALGASIMATIAMVKSAPQAALLAASAAAAQMLGKIAKFYLHTRGTKHHDQEWNVFHDTYEAIAHFRNTLEDINKRLNHRNHRDQKQYKDSIEPSSTH